MPRAARFSCIWFALLLVAACNVTLVQFVVPFSAVASSTIEVVVVANATNGNPGDQVGAVLQLPTAFTVLGAMVTTPTGYTATFVPTRNDPALLQLYTREPGTVLEAFSGQALTTFANPLMLRVRLQVPAAANVYQLKVALATSPNPATPWQAHDPASITNFVAITAAPHVQQITVLSGPGPLAPAWIEHAAGLPFYDTGNWCGVAFGDVDRDGRQELGCIARLGNGPHVLRNAGTAGWIDSSGGLLGSPGRSDVAFGDFNGDGVLDLADGNGFCFLGNGGLSWTGASTGITSFGSEGVAVGDVNGDGFDDVAFAGHVSPALRFWFSNGNGTWRESSTGLPTAIPPNLGQAGGHELLLRDVNGDGFLDLVWCRIQATGIWLGDGAGNWTEVANNGIHPHQMWGVDAFDADGDGRMDLVFGAFNDPATATTNLGIRLYRQQPGLVWLYDPNSGLPTTGSYLDVAVADFDRDGVLDIVAGRAGLGTCGIEIWRGLPGGTFVTAPFATGLPASCFAAPEGIAVGDVDDDTFPDIAVASYGLGVVVYRNMLSGFSRYGAGCRGAAPAIPQIGANGAPNLGNLNFTWTLTGARPAAPVFLVLGTSRTFANGTAQLPYSLAPLGAPGCFVLAEPLAVLAAIASASGSASQITPIPAAGVLPRQAFFGQWGAVDPTANLLGLTFSGGGAVRIGP